LLDDSDKKKIYFVTHSERDWKFFINIWEAFQIFRIERPTLILSTGAGPAVPFSLIGKYLFDTRIVYIETMTSINRPSLTGKIMYYIADIFFYQWRELGVTFPKGKYCGLLV
jgi:UDP-N-acetylglucosamine:LPS N-acetylglucosamine transferase